MFPYLTNNVYAQIGLITLIGLAAKNAILIVEFAKERVDKGEDLLESTIEAVRLRLRPILMTSLAFILGVFPLALATWSGGRCPGYHWPDGVGRYAGCYVAGYFRRAGSVCWHHPAGLRQKGAGHPEEER